MKTFEEDLKEAALYHGHICAGQILGVRMARLGVRKLALEEPQKYRDLVVFVESDRCLSDAVSTVTGCKLGKRRLKHKDYGKSAASFLDLRTSRAVRVSSIGWVNAPANVNLLEYFAALTDEELFKVEEVEIPFPPCEAPGKPVEKIECGLCGEMITDSRHIIKDGKALCKSCAGFSYYKLKTGE
ncbi:MAG: FmdE family protein [Spirochaetaceae bacterium]|jgi:formylmethanofuran dehydrogenase subunit E|nr:FmdE family protein [Spirochaetaceae bacterium]